ncbi:hypothetical protein EW026_g5298 [Hermanssonia centrifuga]|uniref:Uncharacterized protein n=1 Tax=Hermanssonia centrifuga TaxID=98765 RepID=A0A4S4KEX9_9APHY|nr:hypothetical protein EW026_g5298 [Hermanssonia centrifuga]
MTNTVKHRRDAVKRKKDTVDVKVKVAAAREKSLARQQTKRLIVSAQIPGPSSQDAGYEPTVILDYAVGLPQLPPVPATLSVNKFEPGQYTPESVHEFMDDCPPPMPTSSSHTEVHPVLFLPESTHPSSASGYSSIQGASSPITFPALPTGSLQIPLLPNLDLKRANPQHHDEENATVRPKLTRHEANQLWLNGIDPNLAPMEHQGNSSAHVRWGDGVGETGLEGSVVDKGKAVDRGMMIDKVDKVDGGKTSMDNPVSNHWAFNRPNPPNLGQMKAYRRLAVSEPVRDLHGDGDADDESEDFPEDDGTKFFKMTTDNPDALATKGDIAMLYRYMQLKHDPRTTHTEDESTYWKALSHPIKKPPKHTLQPKRKTANELALLNQIRYYTKVFMGRRSTSDPFPPLPTPTEILVFNNKGRGGPTMEDFRVDVSGQNKLSAWNKHAAVEFAHEFIKQKDTICRDLDTVAVHFLKHIPALCNQYRMISGKGNNKAAEARKISNVRRVQQRKVLYGYLLSSLLN